MARGRSESNEIAELRARAALAPMLEASEEAELLARVQRSDDPRALDRLIVAHERMVVAVAARHARRGIPFEDLVAEGNLGLVEAARRFDASRAARFATFAAWWVRARISRFALANRRIVGAPSTRGARQLLSSLGAEERRQLATSSDAPTRAELAARLGVSLDDVELVTAFLRPRDPGVGSGEGEFDLQAETPLADELLEMHEEAKIVERVVADAISALDAREADIVRRRLLDDEPETLAEIGTRHGLSRERIRQLELRACQKLRGTLALSLSA